MKTYYVLWVGDTRTLWFKTKNKEEAIQACVSSDMPCDVCIVKKGSYVTQLCNLAVSPNIYCQRPGGKIIGTNKKTGRIEVIR